MNLRIICYDIENDKFRNKTADTLLHYGFERLQYSVFCGKIEQHLWEKCWKKLHLLEQKFGGEGDKIFAIILSAENFRNMEYIGKPLDNNDEILNEIITLWI
jgi:CRISPR-associated endonuclease Cas2